MGLGSREAAAPLVRTWLAMAALLVAAALAAAAFDDRIPLHEGFGFEGFAVYKPIIEDLPGHLRERRIDSYSVQRLFPFALAHVTLRALGQPLRTGRILRFFRIYNLVVLILAVGVWLQIAADHDISRRGRWLGFLGLFANFAVMKFTFYYPLIALDVTAVLLSLLGILCYRRESPGGLLVLSLVGLVVWPTMLLVHAVLLLLPPGGSWGLAPRPLAVNRALILGAVGALLAVFAYAYFVVRPDPQAGIAPPVLWALPASFLAVGAWMWLGLLPLVGAIRLEPRDLTGSLARGAVLRGAAAVAFLGVSHLVLTRMVAGSLPPRLDTHRFLVDFLPFYAASRPAQFLVSHVLYFGPVVLVAVLLWKDVARVLHRLGPGLPVAAAYAVVMGLNSESRHLTNVLPLVVLGTVLVLEERHLALSTLVVTGVFAALLAKVWLPINTCAGALGGLGPSYPLGAGNLQCFPAQFYFMNFGPWISNAMLLAQGVPVLVLGVWLRPRLQSLRAGVR